jgi:hypothetical protein
LVWRNGRRSTRALMMEQIRNIGQNYQRQVIVIQPHLAKDTYEAAEAAGPRNRNFKRLRQLHTLLLSAESSCRALGANLVVVGAR